MQFSVCICVYDKDNVAYFKEALKSIVHQSLLPDQIVLVVDGLINDKLQRVIMNFQNITTKINMEFDVFYLKQNVGHGKARRISIEKAKYELIALMDADDISKYSRFEKQIEIFKNSENLSVLGSQIMEVDHDTKQPISIKEVPLKDKEIKEYLKTRCPFNQMTVMFKRTDVLSAGNYIDFYHNEDYYLWLRMYLNGAVFCNHPDILVLARVNQKFYNRRGGIKYFLSEYKIQKFMLKHSIISFLRFCWNIVIRSIIQLLLPESVRGYIFQKLFRKEVRNV